MPRIICAFAICISHKTHFLMAWFTCTIKIFVPRHVASLLHTSTICGSVRVTLCPCTYRVRSGDFPPTAAVKDNTPSLPVKHNLRMNKHALLCEMDLSVFLTR